MFIVFIAGEDNVPMHTHLSSVAGPLITARIVLLISAVVRPLPAYAETHLAPPLERCGWIADEPARMRCDKTEAPPID